MERCRSAVISAETHRLADDGMPHKVNVEKEAADQRAQREENRDSIWIQGMRSRHGARNKRSERAHEHARDDANSHAFSRDRLARSSHGSVGLANENDG